MVYVVRKWHSVDRRDSERKKRQTGSLERGPRDQEIQAKHVQDKICGT